MDLKQQLDRIKYIEYLITSKQANTLKTLAVRTNVTSRQVQNIINLMKEMGAPIRYDERLRHYYFEENKKFVYKYE